MFNASSQKEWWWNPFFALENMKYASKNIYCEFGTDVKKSNILHSFSERVASWYQPITTWPSPIIGLFHKVINCKAQISPLTYITHCRHGISYICITLSTHIWPSQQMAVYKDCFSLQTKHVQTVHSRRLGLFSHFLNIQNNYKSSTETKHSYKRIYTK